MSDSNKIGSPPSNPSPDEDNVFANFDAGLAKVPPQPFSLYQNQQQQQQDQGDQGDDGSDQEKKDQIKTQQQKADQLAEAQKEASTIPASTTPAPAKPATPAPTKTPPPVPGQPTQTAQKTPPTAQQKQPSPFSLAGQTGKPSQKPDTTGLQPQVPQGQTPPPTTKGTSPTKLGESPAQQTAAQAKQALTEQGEVSSQTQAGVQQQATVQSQQAAAQVVAGQVGQQMTAQGQASKAQTASTTSSISQRFTTAQAQTDEADESYKSRQTQSQNTDVQDNRLQQRYTGEQVADQMQSKTDTTPSPTTAPSGSTGASVAERVVDVLKTQEDFINLVASVATNEKMTQVQLKDGTTINLNRTVNGLDIAVTTPDTRVQQLLLSSKSSITSALSAKNIKVANLQVSLELQGPSNQPIEGTGRES